MSEFTFWSATRLANAIRTGDITSREAVAACIDRIERFDGALNAVCVRLFDQAIEQADAADDARARGVDLGPLHGVPMTVKEAYDVVGTASTWGLSERANHVAVNDAEVIRRLRAAGAVLLGKTNVPPNLMDWQSDNPVYGRTHNPWNLERTPGGSSGGSAVSLAAGFAHFEAGSDIGGSLRNPAHFCGVCAHKPTFGIVPRQGQGLRDCEPAGDLSVSGPMARYVEDLELGMRLMVGPEPRDGPGWRVELPPARHERVEQYRVAVITEEPVCRVASAVQGAIARVADAFEAAGVRVERDVALPFDTREAHRTYLKLLRGAGCASDQEFDGWLEQAGRHRPEDDSYRAQIARAYTQTHRDWHQADAERMALRRQWSAFFGRYDVLLCPAAPTTAWAHDPRERFDREIDVDGDTIGYYEQLFWAGVTIASYLPSTVIPAGLGPDGLPIGVQIVADHLQDHTALTAARLIESAAGGFVPAPDFG